jgi:DNA ligase-4
MHWRKPTGTTAEEKMGGDFGTAVYLSLRSRCPDRGDLTVGELNDRLDELNVCTERKERVKVLKQLLHRTSASQQKWIVRIILKELKIGMSEKTILSNFHPDALELFNVSSNLRTVCKELKNPTTRIQGGGSELTLFHPIKPMLATRQSPEDVVKV